MKEKLSSALGSFGGILWYIISFLYSFAPLFILRFPFWVDLILIGVILFLPIIGEIVRIALYVWAFVVAIGQPVDIVSIIFFVFAALYAFTTLVPFITATFGNKNG